MQNNQKISVTIITGFLGAGKTTFINQLLKEYPEKQFALVENEFGEVSIDTKLIKGVDASRMFELKQGCICCTISDEYELVLAELAERFPNVEHLLIETTGIADPVPVIRPFFMHKKLQQIYRFTGTICMVDAINYKNLPEKQISLKQIAVADSMVISKSEHITLSEKEKLITEIVQINPLSKVLFSEFGIAPDFNLQEDNYKHKFYPEIKPNKLSHFEITSKTLTFSRPLNKEKFRHWLTYNLDVYKSKIYRVKGILCFENEPYEFILQGVGGSFEINEGDNLVDNQLSEIVFIGRLDGLNLDSI